MPKKNNVRRPDGRIAVQIYLGMIEGKRKYKTVYGKTQKQADAAAAKVRSQLSKGIDLTADNNTFGYWAELWLRAKKNETSFAQYQSYKNRILYFRNEFEDSPILSIKLYELQSVIDELAAINPNTGRPTAKKTLRDIAQSARQVYEYAIANRVVEYNPALQIKVPQGAPKGKRRALSEKEIKRINETPHRAQLAAMIMLYTGLRRGEVAALTWNDIDLEKRAITVSKAIDYKNGSGVLIKAPKTEAGVRTVPMPELLVDFIKIVKHQSLYVIPSKAGTIMSESAWQRLWMYYMHEMNRKYGDFSKLKALSGKLPKKLPMLIDTFTPHCLRHTYCTMLYESGIDVVVAQQLMGHADIKTTLGIYTHLNKNRAQTEVAKLNEYLSCKSADKSKPGKAVDT